MSEASKDYSLTLARVVLGTGALLHGIAETFHVWGGGQLVVAVHGPGAAQVESPESAKQ